MRKVNDTKLAFGYEDGHIQKSSETFRGIRHKGQRPVDLYVDKTVDNQTVALALHALHPAADPGYVYLYTGTETYVIKDGIPQELLRYTFDTEDKERYVHLQDGSKILYEEHLDGPALSQDEAKEQYPEWFI